MQQFTKKDLKTGDVIVMRDGSRGIIIREYDVIIHPDGWSSLGYRDENLLYCGIGDSRLRGRDIMKVCRPTRPGECRFDLDVSECLVYERKEPVEMTLEEICAALGKDIKIVKEK
jgi:hypothetical protein